MWATTGSSVEERWCDAPVAAGSIPSPSTVLALVRRRVLHTHLSEFDPPRDYQVVPYHDDLLGQLLAGCAGLLIRSRKGVAGSIPARGAHVSCYRTST